MIMMGTVQGSTHDLMWILYIMECVHTFINSRLQYGAQVLLLFYLACHGLSQSILATFSLLSFPFFSVCMSGTLHPVLLLHPKRKKRRP